MEGILIGRGWEKSNWVEAIMKLIILNGAPILIRYLTWGIPDS